MALQAREQVLESVTSTFKAKLTLFTSRLNMRFAYHLASKELDELYEDFFAFLGQARDSVCTA